MNPVHETAPQLRATAEGPTTKTVVPFTATNDTAPDPARLIDFLDMLNWSALRLLQGAITDGDAHYWQRRAKDFEWARPRPGEWRGQATEAERDQRDQRLAETAAACRAKAAFVELYGDPELTGAASIVLAGLMNDYRREAAA